VALIFLMIFLVSTFSAVQMLHNSKRENYRVIFTWTWFILTFFQ
jgi:hypothetical protein